MTVALNEALQNRQADSWGSDLDLGFIDLYTGTQPADPNDAPTGTLLVSCVLAADAYAVAAGGNALLNGTASGTAVATGTAGYAQQRNAANTRWAYGSVTETGLGGDVQLSTVLIVIDKVVAFTTSQITQPAS